jgi:nucleotide-binding universal stress UspA family protein
MFNRILVPLDGSPLAEAILPPATELARKFDATLVLLRVTMSRGEAIRETVSPDPITAAPLSIDVANQLVEAQDQAAEQYLSGIREGLASQKIACETAVIEGNAAMVLTEAVRERNIDLIAMATHARSGLGRIIFGSVADSVIRDVNVPVLLVHAKG